MKIDQYKFSQSMLRIARIELKKRYDRIATLENESFQHIVDKRILYVIIAILTVGYVMLLTKGDL